MAEAAAPRVRVVLPEALRRLFPGMPAEVELEAATVDALLMALDRRWPGMRDRLRDSTPRLRRTILVWVDGRRATLETPLQEGSTVAVTTAVMG